MDAVRGRAGQTGGRWGQYVAFLSWEYGNPTLNSSKRKSDWTRY